MELKAQGLHCTVLLLVFLMLSSTATESATITPTAIEDACPNDMVNLTCSVTGQDNLLWDLPAGTFGIISHRYFDDENDKVGMRTVLQDGPYAVTLDSVAPNMLTSTLEVTLLNFLDGQVITCSRSSVVIKFRDLPNAPANLQPTQTVNGSDSSIVTIQWEPQQSNESPVDNYTVSVTPTPVSGEATSMILITQTELVLNYNQPYTVQVVATNCMGISSTSATITFTLVRCGDPPAHMNGQVIGVDRIEGSTVTLMCDDGYTPVGNTFSTCTSDMTWEPDPVLFECIPVTCALPPEPTNGAVLDYESFNQTVEEGTMLTYQCDSGLSLTGPMTIRCTNDGEWSDDPEGIMCVTITQGTSAPLINIAAAVGITLAVSAVVFTILGFLTGLLVMYLTTHKKGVYSPTEGQANVQPTVTAGPVYEDVLPAPKEEIELKTNNAYGPVRQ